MEDKKDRKYRVRVACVYRVGEHPFWPPHYAARRDGVLEILNKEGEVVSTASPLEWSYRYYGDYPPKREE